MTVTRLIRASEATMELLRLISDGRAAARGWGSECSRCGYRTPGSAVCDWCRSNDSLEVFEVTLPTCELAAVGD